MALVRSDYTFRRARMRLLLLAGTMLTAGSALAQDATWRAAPATNELSTGTNWDTNTVPTGTGFFDVSGTTAISNSANTTLGGFTFNAGASAYTFTNTVGNTLTFNGAGIVNNSGQTQTFVNQAQFDFRVSSSAGNAFITNSGELAFYDSATAGNATITNNFHVVFVGSSTAGSALITNTNEVFFYFNSNSGNATINNGAGAKVHFQNNSSASNSIINNNGDLNFLGTSTAGSATITNNFLTTFFDDSTAGNSTITNNAGQTVAFRDRSTAGNAVIVNNGGLNFVQNATGGNATLVTNSGATTNFSFSTGPNNDGKLSAGSIAGAGSYVLGTNELTVGGNGASTTVSGVISGAGGSLVKTGAGTLTLSGANTYTGATTVSVGKLVVNGSLASAVTVNGGSLGGSGSVGGIAVASGGTVAPGNSIGTLNVAGNVAFAAGSTYQVEVNAAGQGDRIVASGLATLSGGTVQVLAENGNYAAATSYTILTATGGVTGQFATVTSNLAFLTPSLVYDAQNVTLTMTRNDISFGPGGGNGNGSGSFIAQTRNQGGIAISAERLGAGNPIYDTLISATAAEARAGFDLLSGEGHAQGVAVAIGESRLVREAVLGRLRGSLLTLPGAPVAGAFSADLPGRKGAVEMPAPRFEERFAIWGEAVGAHANTDADGNAAGLSRRTGGAILGADMKLYDSGASSLRVGVAGGYTQSNFDVDARLSSGKLESGHALLYAGARYGNWRLDGGLGYSFGETSLTRQVRIRGFGDSLRSERDTELLQGFAELGYAFRFERLALEPFAQLALLRVSSGSALEQGGAAALRVFSGEQNLGFTTLGLRAEAQLGAMPLFARGLLGWRYGFGDLTPQAMTGFIAGTTPARVFATQIDRNALVAEAGLDWRATAATTLGLGYSAAIGERTRDHALKGRFEVRF